MFGSPPAPPASPASHPHAFPQLSTTARSLGKARRVKQSALIYLFESLIHQPLQMTLAADDYRIPNPTPPCSDKTGVWGGGDYHKKHTNQRGTMNPVTGRRRRWRWYFFFPFPFWWRCGVHVTTRDSIHRMIKFYIFHYWPPQCCCSGGTFMLFWVQVQTSVRVSPAL